MDQIVKSDWDVNVNVNWKHIDPASLIILHQGIVIQNRAFYFRMIYKTVNSLIDTGILKHIVDNHLRRKRAIKNEEATKVLSLDELHVGFNIWLGCCLIAFGAFMLEKLVLPRKKHKSVRKLKYVQIHPIAQSGDVDIECIFLENSREEIYKKFKAKKIKDEQVGKRDSQTVA
jgi:hypothetical protein